MILAKGYILFMLIFIVNEARTKTERNNLIQSSFQFSDLMK